MMTSQLLFPLAAAGLCLAVLVMAAAADTGLPGPSPRAGLAVSAPRPSLQQASDGFAERQAWLLRALAAKAAATEADDLYGNRAIARLQLGLDPAQARAQLRWVAEWFGRPTPNKHPVRAESDFAAMRLARAFYLFHKTGALDPATLDAIQSFFTQNNFQSIYNSENHHLLFHTSRYLMGSAYPEVTFKAWKKTGSALAAQDAAWLEQFIQYRAAHGWGEFDSSCYIRPDMEALLSLYDFAPSTRLQKLSGMMLDLLLADVSVDSLDGMVGGAQGRIYARMALDHAAELTWPINFVYFGNVDRQTLNLPDGPEMAVDTLTSTYRLNPIVLRIALDRPQAYANRERKHLHNILDVLPAKPLPGSIRKLTHYTPDYTLGAVVLQDAYPPKAPAETRSYAWHEQHDWDLSFATNTRARLFTHHPGNGGNEHGYWTGDLGCGCGQFFQNGTVVLAMYQIPANQPYKFIHAFVPRAALDEVQDKDGWIFVRAGKAYGALKIVGGYEWTTTGPWANVEVRSTATGNRHAAVCQAALASDYPDFQAFQREILSNAMSFDPDTMELTYASKPSGKLTFSFAGRREVDGKPIDLDYPTYDSPYLQSAWGSGVVDLIHGTQRLRLDFPNVTVKKMNQP